MVAVQQLQDVQNELDRHKAEVNRDLYNEISKELIKVIFNFWGQYTLAWCFVTKAQVVEAIKKFIPNFEHEEKGKNLDRKM